MHVNPALTSYPTHFHLFLFYICVDSYSYPCTSIPPSLRILLTSTYFSSIFVLIHIRIRARQSRPHFVSYSLPLISLQFHSSAVTVIIIYLPIRFQYPPISVSYSYPCSLAVPFPYSQSLYIGFPVRFHIRIPVPLPCRSRIRGPFRFRIRQYSYPIRIILCRTSLPFVSLLVSHSYHPVSHAPPFRLYIILHHCSSINIFLMIYLILKFNLSPY